MEDHEQHAIDEAEAMLGSFFGEGFPEQCKLSKKGDGIVGQFVRIDEDVDLKTDFAPVDMLILSAITGVWHGDEGVERARKGTNYAVALMHQTLRNRITEALPIEDGEVIAIRRGRVFESSFNPGNEAVAYSVVFPDRKTAEAAEAESTAETAKAAETAKPRSRSRKPAETPEAPF